MSSRYLLPCPCGKTIPVSVSQAGDRVRCECGVEVDVPTFRQLRELEPEGDGHAVSAPWGFRQGALTLGVLVALLLATGGGYFAWQKPTPPPPFDPVAWMQEVDARLEQLTPTQAWSLWTDVYRPLSKVGLTPMTRVGEKETLAKIERSILYRNRLLLAAGIVLAVTLVATPLLPRSRPSRS